MNVPQFDFPQLVCDMLIAALKDMSNANCYVAPSEAFDPAMLPTTLQVIDDGGTPALDPGGNCWGENVGIRITIFKHLSTDRSGRVSDVLGNFANGLKVTRFAVMQAMVGNRLGVLDVGFKFVERSSATAYDQAPGWVSQSLRFSGVLYARMEA